MLKSLIDGIYLKVTLVLKNDLFIPAHTKNYKQLIPMEVVSA